MVPGTRKRETMLGRKSELWFTETFLRLCLLYIYVLVLKLNKERTAVARLHSIMFSL